MADDVLVEKVFNYICGSGGFVEISALLKHSSPLGSRKSELEARNWLKTLADRRFVVVKDHNGDIAGVRIDLRKKICREYRDRGSCKRAQGKCKFWHICKYFIEENCVGNCSHSHNFFDNENLEKTKELGLDKHANGTVRNIVVWSLPQVCQLYARGECMSDKCLYLHVCAQAVRGSSCPCLLSHNLTDPHNKKILKQHDLVPHQSMTTEFVRCSILVPKEQRVFDKIKCSSEGTCTCSSSSENTSTGLVVAAPDTVQKLAEISTPSSQESQCNTTEQLQGSSSNISSNSKQRESECKPQLKTRSKEKNRQAKRQQDTTTKPDSICESSDLVNNLADNSTSLSSENRLEFMNIQAGEDCNTSDDENKSASTSVKSMKCKVLEEDDTNAAKRSQQKSKKTTPSSESVIVVKVDGVDSQSQSASQQNGSEASCKTKGVYSANKRDKNDVKNQEESKQESKNVAQTSDGAVTPTRQGKRVKKGASAGQTNSGAQPQKQLDASHNSKGTCRSDSKALKMPVLPNIGGLLADDASNDFVETWVMGSDSPNYKELHTLPASQDVEVERQRKLSVSSSCSSVQDPSKGTPSKKAVFDCILNQYNGTVAYDVIVKRQDLFPNGCGDIVKWFGSRKDSFLLREKEGTILEVSVFCRRARLCFNQNCLKKDCQFFHVCREYIAGFCRLGNECQRNHSFQYDEDRKFTSKVKLGGLTEEHLRTVLKLSMPQVCLDYNNGCCAGGLSCGKVHICKDFIKKRCEDEEYCGLQHESAFGKTETNAILQNYGLRIRDGNVNPVLRMLLVCESISSGYRGHATAVKKVASSRSESNRDQPFLSKEGAALLEYHGLRIGDSNVNPAPRTLQDQPIASKEAAVANREPSEMKVFECLCKDYDCCASFSVLSKRTDLFPSEFKNVESWFRKKKGSFLITEDDQGMISQVEAYSTKARLCLSYNNTSYEECKRENCSYLHVCREFIADSCSNGATCPRNHHFQDERNQALLSKIKLDQLTDEQLRKLVLSSTPQICVEYNSGMCDRGDSCTRIHMCRDHLRKCRRELHGCGLQHEDAMKTEHTRSVLKRHQLEQLKLDVVKRIILVCDQHKETTKGKDSGNRHILQDKPDAPICSDFLFGKCKNGSKCSGHHCPLPYHWQYSDQGEWKSFSEEDNEKLEKLYCNEKLEECSATGLQISFESDGFLLFDEGYDVSILLDNKLMIIQKDFEAMVEIRRLSTYSYVYVTDPNTALATDWIWYWKDEHEIWRKYDQDNMGIDIQRPLEKAFLNKKNDFKFRIAEQDYILSFTPGSDMSQINLNYGTTRKVRRRPANVVTKDDIRQRKRLHNVLPAKSQPRGPKVPSHWSPMSSTKQYKRVPLAPRSYEFKEVEKLFRQSIRRSVVINSIERVQNPFMWEKYQRKRENMSTAAKTSSTQRRSVNETQLFHGTNPEIVEAICKQNFDWRLHGKNATVFGEGSYFALNSSYSDAYAKEDIDASKFMFVARVLVGVYTTGHASYRRPPQKDPADPASDLYDSCVNDRLPPTIFVVFDTDQFYPEYIIKYSTACQSAQGIYYGGVQQPAATRAPVPNPRRPQAVAVQPRASRQVHNSSLAAGYHTPASSSGFGSYFIPSSVPSSRSYGTSYSSPASGASSPYSASPSSSYSSNLQSSSGPTIVHKSTSPQRSSSKDKSKCIVM